MSVEVVTQPRHELPPGGRVREQRELASGAQCGEMERVVQAGHREHGAEHRLAGGAAARAEQPHRIEDLSGPATPRERARDRPGVDLVSGPERARQQQSPSHRVLPVLPVSSALAVVSQSR